MKKIGVVLWLALAACRPPAPAPAGADLETLALRLRARTDEVARLRSKAGTSAQRRREIYAALDDLEEFRTVAAMKVDALRAADEERRAQARDEAEAALNDLEASLRATEKKIQ